jgi:type II secretory pathway pseudopilin PulG
VRVKRGYLLAEALCALALAGLLAAAAATALNGARRSLHESESRDVAERAAMESVGVLRAALEGGHVLGLRGDTAVDVDLAIAIAPICDVEPRAILLPAAVTNGNAPLTAALQSPTVDDVAALRLATAPTDPPVWDEVIVDSVGVRTSGACGSLAGWSAVVDDAAPRWRLVLGDTVPSALAIGDLVRVGRPGRFTLYHAGNGDWMLGWRRCAPISMVCGVVQPVAGPLRAPGAGGLRLRALTAPDRWEIEARGAGSDRVVRATVPR